MNGRLLQQDRPATWKVRKATNRTWHSSANRATAPKSTSYLLHSHFHLSGPHDKATSNDVAQDSWRPPRGSSPSLLVPTSSHHSNRLSYKGTAQNAVSFWSHNLRLLSYTHNHEQPTSTVCHNLCASVSKLIILGPKLFSHMHP